MQDQKLENLLNLAMSATMEERAESPELAAGYHDAERTWELIVRYSGSLDGMLAELNGGAGTNGGAGITGGAGTNGAAGTEAPQDENKVLGRRVEAEELLNHYAILTVPESLIETVAAYPQIAYVEMPKRLYFAVNRARAASCITAVQTYEEGDAFRTVHAGQGGAEPAAKASVGPEPLMEQTAKTAAQPAAGTYGVHGLNLTGRGVLVAVLDSGIDYFHGDFRKEDGTTRIALLWDQTLGRVFTREDINEALAAGSREAGRQLVPQTDGSGHGTAVAGIAAGSGRESGGKYRGVAYESDLLVVKLGVADPLGFPRTTQLMRGLDFAVRCAAEEGMPMAVNLSFGNTYGSHDGTGLLETYIDSVASYGRLSIVIGTGNEGARGGHISGVLTGGQAAEAELSVSDYETGLSVQLWKDYADEFAVTLIAPDGQPLGPLPPVIGPRTLDYGDTRILLYYGEPGPYSMAQEIYFDFMPRRGDYLPAGVWKFRLTPLRVVRGRYDLWLPSSAVLNRATRFLKATPDTTLTIPSTAQSAISVGAYDSSFRSYADFSGRGFTRTAGLVKPELAAPGVGIMAPKPGGGYEAVTGTSFAAPMVAGSAALLMQWGIIDGNDPYLYGEKLKAYLIRGAGHLPGYEVWPNPQLGWGVLCVRDSLPG